MSEEISPKKKVNKTASHYDEFFGPLYFEPYAEEVARRIDGGNVHTALEIACGTGRMTRHIRERIDASARFIASDLSEEMMQVAREKLNDQGIEWQTIDAQHLPFEDDMFDLIVCCFGYMFVPDKAKALSEVYRVLKPGGHFIFTTWDKLEKNGASFTALSVAKEYLDGPLPAQYYTPTSMSGEGAIKKLLKEAGFRRMEVETVGLSFVTSTAKEAADGLTEGGIYEEIRKEKAESIAEIKREVEEKLADKFGAAPMVAPMSALISQVWK